jgi:hypothetical protein
MLRSTVRTCLEVGTTGAILLILVGFVGRTYWSGYWNHIGDVYFQVGGIGIVLAFITWALVKFNKPKYKGSKRL